jgi:CRISPR-associated protein Cas2
VASEAVDWGKIVWLFAFFDLPTVTPAEKRRYVQFRAVLLSRGFLMLQWSVYARAYPSAGASTPHAREIEGRVPPGGRVRLLVVTDHQFGKMVVCDGAVRGQPERPVGQLVLF